MKRSSNFLIAFAAAALTFGTLNLVIGPRHGEWRGHYRHAHNGYHNRHNDDHKRNKEYQDKENNAKDPDNDSSQNDF